MTGYNWERLLFTMGLVSLFSSACSDASPEAARMGGDYSSDADVDGDMDGDADGDGDWEWDDTDSGLVPEVEKELNYIVPQGAGRYVFIADEARDKVVIVDSETLEIRTVEVGSRPTHLVPLHTDTGTSVAVINLNSDEVTVLRMDEDENIETVDIPVRPDTNALAPSPDGRFIIAYHDPAFAAVSGAPSTDQEISVLDVTQGNELSVAAAVGMHPWKVAFNDASTRAFVVTEGGINIVDLENLSESSRTDSVSLFESGTYDANTADIEIVPDGSAAVGRKSDSNLLMVAALDGTGEVRQYTLPSIPSDLDIAKDGTFGVLVMRELGSAALFDLPLPSDETADPFTYVSMEGRQVGLATLTQDGDRILLYTTTATNAMDRNRLTLMERAEEGWKISSAVLERPIQSVATVDGEEGIAETAVVMHEKVTVGTEEKPFGYTLVTLPGLMTKLQQIPTEAGQLLLTPDGAFGFLLLPSSNAVDKMDLDSLIVNTLPLSSPPTAAGYAASTDKVFVAQNHTAGRMTFLGVSDDSMKTVTGYNLNDEIEVSK